MSTYSSEDGFVLSDDFDLSPVILFHECQDRLSHVRFLGVSTPEIRKLLSLAKNIRG